MFIHRIEDLQERADACLMDVLLGKYADLRAAYAASLALGRRAMEDGYIVTLARPVPLESDGSRGLDISFVCDCPRHPLGVTSQFTREQYALHMRGKDIPSASCHVPDMSLATLVRRVADAGEASSVSLWNLMIAAIRFRNDPTLMRVARHFPDRWGWTDDRTQRLVDVREGLTVWTECRSLFLEVQLQGSRSTSFWMCEKLAQFLGTRYSDIPLSL